ncbi:TlpA disulfide reductase family protein [uncultured Duncaniella sp.]|uniref:TlpA family protein disulfide reductase n=1 Tax=uncultured Duncaniella sp. TaxID=2768039 RepID=UPI0025DCD086|nr:TlpA disulfide reductase family protein [uncultured Duncaniella sp.]
MRLTKTIHFAMLAAMIGGMLSCSSEKKADGPMVRFHLEGNDSEKPAKMRYYLADNIDNLEGVKFDVDSLGNYEFDQALPEGMEEADLNLNVGKTELGVHVKKGTTTEVNVTYDPESMTATAVYAGENAEKSRIYNAITGAFTYSKYTDHLYGEVADFDTANAILDKEYNGLKDMLSGVSDSDTRDYYSALAESLYKLKSIEFLTVRKYREKKELADMPEYNEIIASIDPNTEANGLSGLYDHWLEAKNTVELLPNYSNKMKVIKSKLALADSALTYEPNRRRAINKIAGDYLMYGGPREEVAEFMEAFSKYAAKYPEIIEHHAARAKVIMEQLQAGDDLRYIPTLELPDGSTINMKDLFGKVLYVDVWATWCGPCCAEIPYMEKLVERFKGNDKIEFLSFSVDEDRDAWLKKIKADNPAWPQYRLVGDENKKFSEELDITGIPRFIIIAPDGKLMDTDAVRPSFEKIDEILTMAIDGRKLK